MIIRVPLDFWISGNSGQYMLAPKTTTNDASAPQVMVNGVVNGEKTGVNPTLDQKETVRKSADLRAVKLVS